MSSRLFHKPGRSKKFVAFGLAIGHELLQRLEDHRAQFRNFSSKVENRSSRWCLPPSWGSPQSLGGKDWRHQQTSHRHTRIQHLIYGKTHRHCWEEISISCEPSRESGQICPVSPIGSGGTPSWYSGWNPKPHTLYDEKEEHNLLCQLCLGPLSVGCLTPVWPQNIAIHTDQTHSSHLQCQPALALWIYAAANPLQLLGKHLNHSWCWGGQPFGHWTLKIFSNQWWRQVWKSLA